MSMRTAVMMQESRQSAEALPLRHVLGSSHIPSLPPSLPPSFTYRVQLAVHRFLGQVPRVLLQVLSLGHCLGAHPRATSCSGHRKSPHCTQRRREGGGGWQHARAVTEGQRRGRGRRRRTRSCCMVGKGGTQKGGMAGVLVVVERTCDERGRCGARRAASGREKEEGTEHDAAAACSCCSCLW